MEMRLISFLKNTGKKKKCSSVFSFESNIYCIWFGSDFLVFVKGVISFLVLCFSFSIFSFVCAINMDREILERKVENLERTVQDLEQEVQDLDNWDTRVL